MLDMNQRQYQVLVIDDVSVFFKVKTMSFKWQMVTCAINRRSSHHMVTQTMWATFWGRWDFFAAALSCSLKGRRTFPSLTKGVPTFPGIELSSLALTKPTFSGIELSSLILAKPTCSGIELSCLIKGLRNRRSGFSLSVLVAYSEAFESLPLPTLGVASLASSFPLRNSVGEDLVTTLAALFPLPFGPTVSPSAVRLVCARRTTFAVFTALDGTGAMGCGGDGGFNGRGGARGGTGGVAVAGTEFRSRS